MGILRLVPVRSGHRTFHKQNSSGREGGGVGSLVFGCQSAALSLGGGLGDPQVEASKMLTLRVVLPFDISL